MNGEPRRCGSTAQSVNLATAFRQPRQRSWDLAGASFGRDRTPLPAQRAKAIVPESFPANAGPSLKTSHVLRAHPKGQTLRCGHQRRHRHGTQVRGCTSAIPETHRSGRSIPERNHHPELRFRGRRAGRNHPGNHGSRRAQHRRRPWLDRCDSGGGYPSPRMIPHGAQTSPRMGSPRVIASRTRWGTPGRRRACPTSISECITVAMRSLSVMGWLAGSPPSRDD